MRERIGKRATVIAASALLASAALTASANARREVPTNHASTVAQACASAGASYDNHAWRAPEDAFGGFSCTFVKFDGPAALATISPALRRKIGDECSRSSAGTVITIATYTYVGYGCIWTR